MLVVMYSICDTGSGATSKENGIVNIIITAMKAKTWSLWRFPHMKDHCVPPDKTSQVLWRGGPACRKQRCTRDLSLPFTYTKGKPVSRTYNLTFSLPSTYVMLHHRCNASPRLIFSLRHQRIIEIIQHDSTYPATDSTCFSRQHVYYIFNYNAWVIKILMKYEV